MSAKIAKKIHPEEIRLYKRRWLLMCVFIFYTISCGLHWVEFTSITNIVSRYYGVSPVWVEWTSIVFMLAYVLFVFPALYITDRVGIKGSLIIASLGTCVGSVIKTFSVAPDGFRFLMIGQICAAVFTVFTFGLVGRFTACWFGGKEISRAGAIALLGDQLGSAFSFLIPSLMVQDSENVEQIEKGMRRMHVLFAITSTMTLILMICFFKGKPKIPPSLAQIKQKEDKQHFWKSVVKVFSKPSFLLMSLSYGLAVSACNAFSTLLNQLISRNFQEYTQDAGKIGFVFMFSGMLSSLLISYILDKTRHFKGNAVVLSLGATLSLTFFTVVLKLGNITMVYIATSATGCFILGYYATGIQMGIEITYPVSEGIVTSSMLLFVQLISISLTSLYGFVIKQYGDLEANIGLIGVLLLSTIAAALIPSNLKRENVEKSIANVELKEFLPDHTRS